MTPIHLALKRPQVALVLVITALLPLAGCSSGSEDGRSTTLTVRVWSDWTFIETAASEFEAAHPSVRIEVDSIPDGSYFNTLPQLLASEDAPDITGLQVIPGVYDTMAREGLLADLSDVWGDEGLRDAYRQPTVDRYEVDGAPFAISTAIQWVPVVYFNRDLFEDLAIASPESRRPTPGEWNSIVSALESEGKIPLATYGISDEYGAAFILSSLLRSSCGPARYQAILMAWQDSSTEGSSSSASWTSDCAIAALEEIRTWGANGILGPAPSAATSDESLRAFLAGDAGMYVSGSWSTQTLSESDAGFDYDWFLLPPTQTGGEGSSLMIADLDGLGIAANSPNSDLAKQFLGLLSQKEFQSRPEYFNTAGFPPRVGVPVPEDVSPVALSQFEAMDDIGTSIQLTVAIPYHSAIGPLLARMLAGELSPQQVGSALQLESEEA